MNEMQKALLLFIDDQDHNDDHFQELVNLVKKKNMLNQMNSNNFFIY